MQVFVDDVHSPRVVVEVRPAAEATGVPASVVVDRWAAVEWWAFLCEPLGTPGFLHVAASPAAAAAVQHRQYRRMVRDFGPWDASVLFRRQYAIGR